MNMCLFNHLGCSYANSGIRDNIRPLLSYGEFRIILELVAWCLIQICFVGGSFLSYGTKVFQRFD